MKVWYQSKTIWINIILTVSLIATSAIGVGLPVEWSVFIVAICNILMRVWFTHDEVDKKRVK